MESIFLRIEFREDYLFEFNGEEGKGYLEKTIMNRWLRQSS